MEHNSCGLVHAPWVHTCKQKHLSASIVMHSVQMHHKDRQVISFDQACRWLGVTATDTAYLLCTSGNRGLNAQSWQAVSVATRYLKPVTRCSHVYSTVICAHGTHLIINIAHSSRCCAYLVVQHAFQASLLRDGQLGQTHTFEQQHTCCTGRAQAAGRFLQRIAKAHLKEVSQMM